jgi:DNA repair protein RecN (Recombination protein N)
VLRALHISGLGVIEDLDLQLHPGLNVLTGETGAGKTMITVAIALALGQRTSPAVVRAGAKAARVQARFDAPSGTEEWAEDGELLLARTVAADGRGSARAGGQLATISTLAALAPSLVEIHGQHQTQRLLSASAQTAFLDRFAGGEHSVALESFRQVHTRLRESRSRLEELTGRARDREREMDLLAYQVREIETAAVQPGELTRLEADTGRLAHAERLTERASSAEAGLSDEGGGIDALHAAAAAVDDMAALDPEVGGLAERAHSLAEEASELSRALRGYRDRVQADPGRLDEVQERTGAIRALERKYGDGESGILAYLEQARARLEELSGAEDALAELEVEVAQLAEDEAAAAEMVSRGRAAAAPGLASALETELHQLGMEGARVEVVLLPLAANGPSGAESVDILFAGGPGQPPLQLSKIASGGELSRTMLACRSVLADLDDVPTLVFDEVDAGIGGRAGLAVGRRLARLADSRQVLVVTHLPQIACFADLHLYVEKRDGTAVAGALSGDPRVDELSRMLAGLPGSESATTHAAELLEEARRGRSATDPASAPGSKVRPAGAKARA